MPRPTESEMLAQILADEKRRKTDEARQGFHWQGGWHFKRQDDGSVRVSRVIGDLIESQAVIPAAEWASIVCSVSKDGETRERWIEAQEFHG